MPIEPIKIPQNVYIEDRIVGPLTLKQIITVAVGCGFSYALYSLLIQSYGQLSIPLIAMVWLPGVLSFMFAFVKINDLSMFRLVLLTMERVNKPAVRTWSPRRGVVINIRTFNAPDQSKKKTTAAPAKETSKLDELSAILDRPMHSTEEDAPAGEPAVVSMEKEEEINEPRTLPVDKSRVSASPLRGTQADTLSSPAQGSVSIFRDLAPHA